jgi:hypothetical protein
MQEDNIELSDESFIAKLKTQTLELANEKGYVKNFHGD